MNLDQYLVIAGVPGVHKLISTRSNGLVIEDRKEGRNRFVPVRQNQITPLATVGIYVETDEGTVPLSDVFQKMLDALEAHPPVALTASSNELRDYFAAVLPEHDQDRVNITDIKKCIKWFNFMQEKGIFEEVKKETAEQEKEAEVAEKEATTEAPAKKAAAKKSAEPKEEKKVKHPTKDKKLSSSSATKAKK